MTVNEIEGDLKPSAPVLIPYFRSLIDHSGITRHVLHHDYDGSGTQEDPYCVTWIHNDVRNPMNLSTARKTSITFTVSFAVLIVSFTSSAYTGSISEIQADFDVRNEVAIFGLSLFILGFALGPLLWVGNSI